jgi:hypothetical protein
MIPRSNNESLEYNQTTHIPLIRKAKPIQRDPNPSEGKEDFIFYDQHIGGDTVQGQDSCLEFPNADEATKYMTKITENAPKGDLNIKAMMN